jgi:cold-inducible RNA-binding protein
MQCCVRSRVWWEFQYSIPGYSDLTTTGAAMQILIVNIPPDLTDEGLKKMFEEYGKVLSSKVSTDKKTGASEGFGIVEMAVKHEARAAVEGLRGKDMQGKPLRVRILKPDDPFHGSLKPGGHSSGGGVQFRGENEKRGGGAMRRGGMRGS